VAIARRLGTAVACVSLDISEPTLAAARARADRGCVAPTFICADTQIRLGRNPRATRRAVPPLPLFFAAIHPPFRVAEHRLAPHFVSD
jgi:hypothetical protein